MINLKELELKERNIRIYKGNYVVRIMRRRRSLTEARRLVKYIEQFTNCVSIYEDQKQKTFIVQTYKEFKDLADAIKLRNFLEVKLKDYN